MRDKFHWVYLKSIYNLLNIKLVILMLQLYLFLGVVIRFVLDKALVCDASNSLFCSIFSWMFGEGSLAFTFPFEIGYRVFGLICVILGIIWFNLRIPPILKTEKFGKQLVEISKDTYMQAQYNELCERITILGKEVYADQRFRINRYADLDRLKNKHVLFDRKKELYSLWIVTIISIFIPSSLMLRRLISWGLKVF